MEKMKIVEGNILGNQIMTGSYLLTWAKEKLAGVHKTPKGKQAETPLLWGVAGTFKAFLRCKNGLRKIRKDNALAGFFAKLSACDHNQTCLWGKVI